MKNYLLIFVTSLIICSLSCKNLFAKDSLTSNFTHLLLEGDIIGEEFNLPGSKSRGAVSYGVAKTGSFAASQFSNGHYFRPEMVSKLPDVITPPLPGPKEEVNEIPSTTNYYDGGAKLNKITINCKIYANASDCLTNSHCGN